MKFLEWINRKRLKYHVDTTYKRYTMTARGEYMMKYILDKYINQVKPDDYHEAYEPTIQNKAQQWREDNKIQTGLLSIEGPDFDKLSDADLLWMAAHNYLVLLLCVTPPQQREKYYNQINDEKIREMTRKIVEVNIK